MSLDQLQPDVAQKALLELNEHPDTRMDKIQELRALLSQRPDLPFDKTDKGLILFLRARKFDVEKSYEMIVAFYEIKRDNTDIFQNLTPSAEKRTFESGWNFCFPHRDAHGRRLLAFRVGTWDPTERQLICNLRANLIALEILMQEEETQINGIVLIIDFRNFGLAQAKAMQLTLFRRYASIFFGTYPLRIKGIHILEEPVIFDVIFPIVSFFMKQKVRDRVKIHGSNINGLQEFFSKDILPTEYNGDAGPIDLHFWLKRVIDAEEELEHLWN